MLENFTTDTFTYEKLSKDEMERRGILGRLVGVIADSKNPTRNGRLYNSDLWNRVFDNPIMREKIENNCVFGQLGHPEDREEVDMEKIAICMDGLPKKNSKGQLMGVFNIIDTPCGRILKSLCDYGCNIGISSRGTGDIIRDYDGNEMVDPDTYNCECFDAVLVPGVQAARLQYVTESLDKTRYKKTLRDRLTESINSEASEKQKAMRESLHDIGIDLDESLFDESVEYTPKFIDGMTIDELKAERQEYYDDQYQYGKSLPMNRIWDIDYTIKELEKNLTESAEFNYEVVVRDCLGHESVKKFKTKEEAKQFANSQASGLITYINPLYESLDDKYLNKIFVERSFDGTSYTRVIGKDGDNYKLQIIDSPKTKNIIHEYSLSSSDMDIFDGKEVITESINLHELSERVPGLTVDIWGSINGVMGAYQNANKWFDSIKEFIYSDLSCPFFSSFVHELAHTMPGRFDKFGDILHTMDIEIPYPTTLELDNELISIDDAFAVIFGCLDDIKANLNNFIKLTDEEFHGMACSAEELLNDIEQEYPMLFRLRDKWNQCNGDLVDFDKFVAQYVEHKEDLLESLDNDILVYNSEAAKTDLFDVVSPQEMADTFNKPVKDGDEIYYPKEKVEESVENITYKNTEIIENEDGTFNVTINDDTQIFNSLKNAKTYIDMMQPHILDEAVNYKELIDRINNCQSLDELNLLRKEAGNSGAIFSYSGNDISNAIKAKKDELQTELLNNSNFHVVKSHKWFDPEGLDNDIKSYDILKSFDSYEEASNYLHSIVNSNNIKTDINGKEYGEIYYPNAQSKEYFEIINSSLDESLYVSAGKMNDKLLNDAVREFESNAGDYGDALTFVKNKFSQYSLNDQKDIARYINRQLSESIKLKEAQVGRDDSKSIEDVGAEDNTPEPIPEPEKKPEEKEEKKETTIIIKEALNSTEENAADAALSELRVMKNVDKDIIRDVVSNTVYKVNNSDDVDPLSFEEADYFRVLDYVENNIDNDVNNKDINEAVENNEADIDRIYEAFNKNIELEKKLTTLQEQLSASYARETKLREELGKYKNQVRKLAESSKEVEALEKKLERANFQISEIENGISANEHKLNESLENSNKVKSKLTESIRQRDSRIKSLEEELESTKKQNVTQINENKALRKEYDSLQESYADAQKDVAQLKEQYSKKLDQKNELIEKYQKIANRAVDKYIESQAIKLGVTSNEIKNKLPKGYGFKDIDSVCESLQGYKLNMSTLPFSTSSLNEGVSLKARNVRRELLPRNEENEITDLELELASKMLK